MNTLYTTKGTEYEWLGDYNDAPPNFKEITEKQLAQETHFGRHQPTQLVYRQIIDDQKNMIPVTMYAYYDGTGVAVQVDYWGIGYYTKPKPKEPLVHVRWFKFAKCEHDMQHVARLGNCYNRYRCTKCNYTEDVDSSD